MHHTRLESMLVSSLGGPCVWLRGPRPKPSKRPSGRDKTGVLGYVPVTRQHPSTSKLQVPAASPVLARWPVWQRVPSIGSQQNAGQCVTLSKLARAPCGRRHSGKRAHRIAFLRQTLTSSVRFCSDWRVRWLSLPHPGRIESHWASPVWRPWLT